MKHAALIVPVLAALSACGASGAGGNNQAAGNAAVPANAAAPANMAAAGNGSAAATGPLSAHVGRLPSDAVDGVTFLANPLVQRAVEAAVPAGEVRGWVLRADVTSAPIVMREGRLFASGCESHNCGRHWTIQIDPAGTAADVCYSYDAASSQHYAAGRPVEQRTGLCPRSDGQ